MMKQFIFFSVFLLISSFSYGQNLFRLEKVSLPSDHKASISKLVKEYHVGLLDLRQLTRLVENDGGSFLLTVSSSISWEVKLNKNEIRAPNYTTVVTDGQDETIIDRDQCNTYEGFVNNDKDQWVRIYISDNYIKGIIVDKKNGIYIVDMLNSFVPDSNSNVLIYKMADTQVEGFCHVESGNLDRTDQDFVEKIQPMASSVCRIVEIINECDGEYYVSHGSNMSNVLSALQANTNIMDGIYSTTFNIRFLLIKQFIHTNASTDPYSANSSLADPDAIISEFADYWNTNRTSEKRDAALFYTGKVPPSSFELLGAVPTVNGVGAMCRYKNASYAFAINEAFNYYTMTHEIGHLFSATHPDSEGSDCEPDRSVMCSGDNISNVFFAASSQAQINSHIASYSSCLYNVEAFGPINGPTLVCSGNHTYTIDNPLGFGFSWSSSNTSLLSINSSTGVATRVGMGSGWVTIKATISMLHTICGGGGIEESRLVWVGPPNVSTINYSSGYTICTGQIEQLTAFPLNQGPGTTYSWQVQFPSSGGFVGATNTPSVDFQDYVAESSNISVAAINTCGSSGANITMTTVNCLLAYTIYPNPAKDYITIEFEKPVNVEGLPDEIVLYSDKSTIALQTINVQELFSQKAFINDNQIQINAKNMPRGWYYLHVKYGERNKPNMHRVILE